MIEARDVQQYMTTLLHIDASARLNGSASREVAQTFVKAWTEANPDGTVVTRDLGREPVAHFDQAALAARSAAVETLEGDAADAGSLTQALTAELTEASEVLISFGLYNWSVPSTLKAWIDRLPIMALGVNEQGEGPLAGRKVTIVVASGGAYSEGTPKFGWDHATPWLTQVFRDVLGFEVEVIRVELTLAKVVPAMAGLIDLAESNLANAHEAAAAHGARVAISV